ncbi:MAG: hypothetical protein JXR76_22050 [Deltaproteobacteria bacterium]|nr:hypothetical protein [Deltaproteobacteria bacterium]
MSTKDDVPRLSPRELTLCINHIPRLTEADKTILNTMSAFFWKGTYITWITQKKLAKEAGLTPEWVSKRLKLMVKANVLIMGVLRDGDFLPNRKRVFGRVRTYRLSHQIIRSYVMRIQHEQSSSTHREQVEVCSSGKGNSVQVKHERSSSSLNKQETTYIKNTAPVGADETPITTRLQDLCFVIQKKFPVNAKELHINYNDAIEAGVEIPPLLQETVQRLVDARVLELNKAQQILFPGWQDGRRIDDLLDESHQRAGDKMVDPVVKDISVARLIEDTKSRVV